MTQETRTYNGVKTVCAKKKWHWVNVTDTCRKYETRPPSYTIYKNKLKMDLRLKCKT